MRRYAFAAALAGFALFTFAGVAGAQTSNSDLRPLLDRLDRLERDINLLQRQVYRGTGPGGAPVPVNPPDPQAAVNYETRFSQLEDEMRTLTGQVEEVSYNLSQLKHRLDTLSNDVDQRLTALEHGTAPATTAAADQPPRQLGAGANPAEPASRSGVLGTLPASRETAAAVSPAATDPGAGALPSGSATDQYNRAFALLRQADYAGAEQALRGFLQRYPNDPLAGNAQYWLGETYYVRKDYNNAAAAFAEGYQKYPKGGKAADDLLKLAMSLGQLGQKADACRAFARLDRDFPTPPSNVKERAGEERKRIGC